MHMMNKTRTSSSQDGCKLPEFKDFLREIERKGDFSFEPQFNMEVSSNVIANRPELYPSQDDLYKCFFARHARPPTPEHVLLVSDSGLVPPCTGNQRPMHSEDDHFAIASGQHTCPEKATGLPSNPLRVISPFQPGHRLRPLLVAQGETCLKLERSFKKSSAGKKASNDKHKQSEKYRRDEMGAYVQAADILRGSVHPGILLRCSTCIQDMSTNENACSSFTFPENVTATAGEVGSKKTKNQSIEEGLMFQFHMILHHKREEVGSRLDYIRAVASQIWREKQLSKHNNLAKSKKLDADSRAEVLTEVLRKMRHACESHGVSPCACGKHEVDDWPPDTSGAFMTPPSSSSRTSPMVGEKRSRETTKEEEEVEAEEQRRERRRGMSRL